MADIKKVETVAATSTKDTPVKAVIEQKKV